MKLLVAVAFGIISLAQAQTNMVSSWGQNAEMLKDQGVYRPVFPSGMARCLAETSSHQIPTFENGMCISRSFAKNEKDTRLLLSPTHAVATKQGNRTYYGMLSIFRIPMRGLNALGLFKKDQAGTVFGIMLTK
jgi:hypothetical protein